MYSKPTFLGVLYIVNNFRSQYINLTLELMPIPLFHKTASDATTKEVLYNDESNLHLLPKFEKKASFG